MKRSAHLTPGEFELMDILWPLGEASVKEVWIKVGRQRDLAYTTVMTVLDKMHRKGVLNKRKRGKAFLYSPVLGRGNALDSVIEHVVEAYFNGSRDDFLAFINNGSPVTEHIGPPDTNEEEKKPQIAEFLL